MLRAGASEGADVEFKYNVTKVVYADPSKNHDPDDLLPVLSREYRELKLAPPSPHKLMDIAFDW